MKLEFRWKGTDRSTALEEHVRLRAGFALGRFAGRIRQVLIRFEDMNGPKGGVDKRCTVEVTGQFGARMSEARDVDFHIAAARALDMAERAVVRAVERLTQHGFMSIGDATGEVSS